MMAAGPGGYRRCSLQASSIPKGLRPPAQWCEERATLGKHRSGIPNPNGVGSSSQTWRLASMRRNPVGVDNSALRLPRVARGSQPWALMRNPFGIEFRHANRIGVLQTTFFAMCLHVSVFRPQIFNPKGIVPSSPGLRGTSYPGKASFKNPQPQRGCVRFPGVAIGTVIQTCNCI